jgi:hypothetical protein
MIIRIDSLEVALAQSRAEHTSFATRKKSRGLRKAGKNGASFHQIRAGTHDSIGGCPWTAMRSSAEN